MNKKKTGSAFRSAILNFTMVLIAAFAVSSVLFFGMSAISDSLISRYVREHDIARTETSRILDALQSYVSENNIATGDIGRLSDWTRSEKYMHVIVFREGGIIFDSDVGYGSETASGTIYAPNYVIELSDYAAPIFLDSFYEYQLSMIAVFIELIVSFMVFTLIVAFFVGRHFAYIRQIAFGIKVLEGGNLEYEIPVRGNDELSVLAGSLNEMRKVFMQRTERPVDAGGERFADLAAISHDLRTPLTTLILFIEIIKTKKDASEEEMAYYIQKLSVITGKIRTLTENLEIFASDDWNYAIPLNEPRPAIDILKDILPEAVLFLSERGFVVKQSNGLKGESIRVNDHFIYRIIDNVISNIDRYGAHEYPVKIITRRDGEQATISFVNGVSENREPLKTSKLGLSLVKEMMRKMNGACTLSRRTDRFTLKLAFPIANSAR